jgi:glycosyltransferase involved in cell wall biosynthesis
MSEGLRFVLDLRACQGVRGDSGRGAFALSFAQTFTRVADGHDVRIALDGSLPARIPALKRTFAGLLPPEHVAVYDLPRPAGSERTASPWRRRAAAGMRRAFFEWLGADAVHESDWTAWPDGPGLSLAPPSVASPVVRAATLWPGDPAPGTAVDVLLPADADEVAVRAAMDSVAAAVARRRSMRPAQPPRRRLAFVSPFPPEATGIADHVAELLPALAMHYEIDIVVAQDRVDDPWVAANLPLRSVAWFDAHAGEYERVVYQVGNSHFHQHMFGLLQRHPGVVVLHETLLAGALEAWAGAEGRDREFVETLYSSHGYGALLAELREGHDVAALRYPCNGGVISAADGVVVHSEFAVRLAERWHGEGSCAEWAVVPLCRVPPKLPGRTAARERLGIGPGDLLVCSLGFVARAKLCDRLLEAWAASSLARDGSCRLVFVGGLPPGEFAEELKVRALDATLGGRVHVTGFVDKTAYRDYLAAADVAVQLRGQSGGETSAAVLDCLASGLPTVVNDHGWAAELPEDVVVMLPEEAAVPDLIAALEQLRDDAAGRAALGGRGAAYVGAAHSPERAARAYRDALERFAAESPAAAYRRLLETLADRSGGAPSRADLLEVSKCIARNRPRFGLRQLLIDVSALAGEDLRTGVQRVSRAVLKALIEDPPAGYRIEPVRALPEGLRYARSYMHSVLGLSGPMAEDAPVEADPGDRFLGLDLAYNTIDLAGQELVALRDRGVRVDFVVYDLLPELRPDCFPAYVPPLHRAWLRSVSAVADGMVCISKTVAGELLEWLDSEPPDRVSPLDVGSFGLGADVAASLPTRGASREAVEAQAFVAARPTFLMVGTVEPRKGHAQTLAAFERLWKSGADCGLLIVGKEGWDTTELMTRLRVHPERGRRLLWLERATDEVLLRLYESASALLAASEGEGFGLPLVEAAQYGLPVIARDIPVFREVAGDHAFYFAGGRPEDLADAVREWLALDARGEVPSSRDMPWLTWAESTQELVDCVVRGGWSSQWPRVAAPGSPSRG